MIDLEPIAYQLDHDEFCHIDVQLVLKRGRYGVKRWAIVEMGACLNKSGEWEEEPLPSHRSDEFYARCRWATAEEALAFWRSGRYESRFEHYRSAREAKASS